ncbi:MAG: cytochrome-c oxidase, cbb3-type subunit III [Pseudomonadota bacterium]
MPTKVEKDDVTGLETTGHEWDGIKELNRPLPKWWLYTFYATIVYAFIYWVLYPSWPYFTGYFGGIIGGNQRVDLDARLAEARAAQAEYLDRVAAASTEEILADPDLLTFAMAGGESAFADNCAPCHGLGGAGQGPYPALGDDDWIWGGTLDEIQYTINHGIRNASDDAHFNEMPAYGQILEREDIVAVANYVLSLSDSQHDAGLLEQGAVIYEENCAACHGEQGEGIVELGAPNLADQIWLYGGSEEEVIQQISNPQLGVMPPWIGRLDEETIKSLTVYVHTLGGGR